VGNLDRTRKSLAAGVWAFVTLIPLKALVGGAFVFLVTYLIPVPAESHRDLQLGCLIGLFAVLFAPFHSFRVLLDVKQEGYFIHQFLILRTLSATVIALVMARLGFGIRGQFLSVFIGDFVFHLSIAFVALLDYPGLLREIVFQEIDRSSFRNLWRLNFPNFVTSICSRVSYMTDNIIISLVLSPSFVTPFIVTQRLITFAGGQIFGIGNATWASLFQLRTSGNHIAFRKRLLELNRLVMTVGILLLGPIAAFNSDFVKLWLGSDFYGGHVLTVSACLSAIFLAVIALWSWVFSAEGIMKVLVPQYVIFSGVNLASSIFFTYKFGNCGPILGNIFAIFSVTFWVTPRHLKRHFEIPVGLLYRGVVGPFLAMLPFNVVLWLLAKRYPAQGWLSLILRLGFSFGFLCVVAWAFVLTPEERGLWKNRISGFLKRKSLLSQK